MSAATLSAAPDPLPMHAPSRVWWGLEQVPAHPGPSVVAMGVFDGVHRGHAAVVAEAARLAGSRGVRSVVVTFHPHPAVVLGRRLEPGALVSVRRRAELLLQAGADDVLVLPFTHELAAEPSEAFAERVLRAALDCRGVVVGAGYRFGAGGRGDTATLQRTLGPDATVVAVAPVRREDERCSSTLARALAAQGHVQALQELLGRPHRVEVAVRRDDRLAVDEDGPRRGTGVDLNPLDAGAARLAPGRYRARVLPLGCDVGPVLDVDVLASDAGPALRVLTGSAWVLAQRGPLAVDLLDRLDVATGPEGRRDT